MKQIYISADRINVFLNNTFLDLYDIGEVYVSLFLSPFLIFGLVLRNHFLSLSSLSYCNNSLTAFDSLREL